MSIERDFDVSMIAELALREKQIQQNYRPIIGVHKWFARRPGTLFRGLILAEFGRGRLQDTFFAGNYLAGRQVADPFMGGGTPLLEANRLGCDVRGFDVNPMAAWIVREEIDHLDLAAYERAARGLVDALRGEVGHYYHTRCPHYGDAEVPVKFLGRVVREALDRHDPSRPPRGRRRRRTPDVADPTSVRPGRTLRRRSRAACRQSPRLRRRTCRRTPPSAALRRAA